MEARYTSHMSNARPIFPDLSILTSANDAYIPEYNKQRPSRSPYNFP